MFLSSILTIATLAQQPQPKPSLRGLHAVNDQLAWTSGSNATIQRKSNGKSEWMTITPPADAKELDFRDIHAWDAKTAVIMSAGPGSKSRIYRTTDGGASWKLAHQNKQEQGFFDGLTFWDRNRGILVGDPVDGRFTILTTDDGGASWQSISTAGMPAANEGEGAFAASGTSITVGKGGRAWFGTGGEKGGRVFSSTDWGRTWQVAQTPIRHDSASAGIFSVAFQADGIHGFAVGGDYRKEDEAQATLVVTTDGGRTWISATGLTGFRSAIAIRGNGLFVTGPKGSDISLDVGKTWTARPDLRFHAASIGTRMVWLSGSEGRLTAVVLK